MKKQLLILFTFILLFHAGFAQEENEKKESHTFFASAASAIQQTADTNHPNKKRLWLVGGTTLTGTTTSLLLLNEAWYRHYEKTYFHTFNDAREWLQVDKWGHAWTAYNIAQVSTAMWQWASVPKQKAVWLGSLSSLGYMTTIEFLDAHSAKWGWSWADVGANTFRTAFFVVQQTLWQEQRVHLKFSAHYKYYDATLKKRVDELYGNNWAIRSLKDYNAQTYWLSFNLRSFLPETSLPPWLNIAIGYGAEGMFGGFENVAYDKNGTRTFYRPDIRRYRQWYLAPDIDFSRIKTKSKLLRTAFSAINILKIPTPALKWSRGKLRGKHPLSP